MSNPLASVVSKFEGLSADSDAIRLLQLDDIRNLDADGNVKNSFNPGDVMFLTLHLSSYIRVKSFAVTEGNLRLDGTGSRVYTSQVFFTSKEKADLTTFTTPVCPNSATRKFWGNRSGSPVRTINNNETWTYIGSDISKVPYLVDIYQSYTVSLYSYIPPPTLTVAENETHPIGIVFYLEDLSA